MVSEAKRADIRKQYRLWRLAVGKNGLTQAEVEEAARKVYPEFGAGRFWKIENGLDFPSPSERNALAQVLNVDTDDLPAERAVARAS